jgi:hypothetical protein
MRPIRKLLFSVYAAVFLSFSFSPLILSGATEGWYLDVPEYSSTYDGIYYLTEQGVVSGYEDGNFLPDEPVNRVEALKMILGATGHSPELSLPLEEVTTETVPDTVEEIAEEITDDANDVAEETSTKTEESGQEVEAIEPAAPLFPDLELGSWYEPYVKLAYGLNIMTGNDDGTLRPENTVNRAEALKMLINAAGKTSELPPVALDTWYSAYLAYAQEHALLIPDIAGDYLPSQTLTRGELADLIYRFDRQPFASGTLEYGIASYYGYSFDGHNTASGTALDTDGYMAAHKTLAFGTKIRITNLDNETYVDVTVVDRGPYTDGYVVDLTPAAFEQIGALSSGILRVRLEVLN